MFRSAKHVLLVKQACVRIDAPTWACVSTNDHVHTCAICVVQHCALRQFTKRINQGVRSSWLLYGAASVQRNAISSKWSDSRTQPTRLRPAITPSSSLTASYAKQPASFRTPLYICTRLCKSLRRLVQSKATPSSTIQDDGDA